MAELVIFFRLLGFVSGLKQSFSVAGVDFLRENRDEKLCKVFYLKHPLKGCFKFQNGKKKCLRFHHRFDLRPHQNGDENGVKMKTETPRSGFLSVFMKNIDTKKEIINSLAEGFKLRKVKGSKDN